MTYGLSMFVSKLWAQFALETKNTRDFAMVKGDGIITLDIAKMTLDALEVDEAGLDDMDNKILLTIIDKFNGGPVGLNTLATAVSEQSDTIEELAASRR